jgi:hypothetical protein
MGKLTKEEIDENHKKRIQVIKNAKTPEELSFLIWSKSLDVAMGSSRDIYRKPFVVWITEIKNGLDFSGWNYKTPKDIVEDIYKPYLDLDDKEFYNNLRETIQHKIEEFIL